MLGAAAHAEMQEGIALERQRMVLVLWYGERQQNGLPQLSLLGVRQTL